MSIYYLNANDFGQEGEHLVANIGGLTFLMFHSQRCGHCMKFLPEFQNMPGAIRGVNFGLCNVDNANKIILQMSSHTSTPITSVPKFILYNDGVPAVEYKGQRSRQAILAFLTDMIKECDQKQSFVRPKRSRQPGPAQERAPQMVSAPPQMEPPGPAQQPYKISNTGVKEYETSYGRPYNTLNEADFLEYENAYKQLRGER